MMDLGAGMLRAGFVAVSGERKDVKMRRSCEKKSGFGSSR